MKITRLEDAIERSTIDANGEEMIVGNLPPHLQEKVVKLLKKLDGAKRIDVNAERERRTIEWASKITTTGALPPSMQVEFHETLELLRWFVLPHWRGERERIGAPIHCVDCGHSRIPGSDGNYCGMPTCPSHKKWRAVLGPSYRAPTWPIVMPRISIRKTPSPVPQDSRKRY